MSTEAFKQGLTELYQGELMGEAVIEQLLRYFTASAEQAKLAVLLQLETETKARLRPAVMELGLPLLAEEETLAEAKAAATAFADLEWTQVMGAFSQQLPPVVERFQEIADNAPDEYKELAQSMVVHEQALLDFANLEARGETAGSIDGIVAQLHFKLTA